jgi:hypothetical protein
VPKTNNKATDIKKAQKNTSICSFFATFFEKVEDKSIIFCPKFYNSSPFSDSIEISSDPKYDINTTQNI